MMLANIVNIPSVEKNFYSIQKEVINISVLKFAYKN